MTQTKLKDEICRLRCVLYAAIYTVATGQTSFRLLLLLVCGEEERSEHVTLTHTQGLGVSVERNQAATYLDAWMFGR